MKKLFTAFLFFIAIGTFAQHENALADLQWKLNPGDTLHYKTAMELKTTLADITSMFIQPHTLNP